MNRPTIADQMLVASLSPEIQCAIYRIYGDDETRQEQFEQYRRKIRTEVLSECKDTIRTWNSHQEADVGLTPKAEEDLINSI